MKITVRRLVARCSVLLAGASFAVAAGAQQPAAKDAPAKAPVPATASKSASKPGSKAAGAAPASQFKLVVEPRAMELLKTMSDKLAAAKTMSFTAVVGYEYPSKLGPPIVYSTRYDVTLQRPDKLRVLIPGDGPASEFYYNGKTMVAYAPVENLAAVADAPPTVDAALDNAFKTASIYFPFEDLLAANPYAALTTGAILAFYIGPSSVVGGVKTDMMAWANKDVFLQIWIGADDKLPRRVRAMFSADPLGLRHQVDYADWQLDPVVANDAFVPAKLQSAGRMAFASPSLPPRAVKPLTATKGKAAPAKAN